MTLFPAQVAESRVPAQSNFTPFTAELVTTEILAEPISLGAKLLSKLLYLGFESGWLLDLLLLPRLGDLLGEVVLDFLPRHLGASPLAPFFLFFSASFFFSSIFLAAFLSASSIFLPSDS